MNRRTKNVLIIITFIFLLVLVIMYFVTMKVNLTSQCDLIKKMCIEGYHNASVSMNEIKMGCEDVLKDICR